MTTGYRLAYAVGATPWEAAGVAGAEQLAAVVTRARGGLPGRALDLGCGTGAHSVALARAGWEVTGVDVVARAVRRAQERARAAGVAPRFLVADVTDLDPEVGAGFDLLLDIGCFHGLRDAERTAMARSVTRVAAPGASLVLLAFAPGAPGPLPRGASEHDILRAFTGWELEEVVEAPTEGMPRALRSRVPEFYRLRLV